MKEVIGIILAAASIWRFGARDWLLQWQHRRRVKAAVRKEKLRIQELPKIDTRLLLKLPEFVSEASYGRERMSMTRTFYYQEPFLLVFDESGHAWIGFPMPDTLVGLRKGEYIEKEYRLPISGDCPNWIIDNTVAMQQWNKFRESYRAAREEFPGNDFTHMKKKILPEVLLLEWADERNCYQEQLAKVERY